MQRVRCVNYFAKQHGLEIEYYKRTLTNRGFYFTPLLSTNISQTGVAFVGSFAHPKLSIMEQIVNAVLEKINR